MVRIIEGNHILGSEANPHIPIDKLLKDDNIQFVDKKYDSDGLYTFYFRDGKTGDELVYNKVSPDTHHGLRKFL
ncbi:DNA mismatch repair protein [Acrasis kona]|uniref:DNA mismatch repair protein n=1 Tax=Acrasis kona TaxID=1008807 RepID=A0AAW2Z1D0_9EUKA